MEHIIHKLHSIGLGEHMDQDKSITLEEAWYYEPHFKRDVQKGQTAKGHM